MDGLGDAAAALNDNHPDIAALAIQGYSYCAQVIDPGFDENTEYETLPFTPEIAAGYSLHFGRDDTLDILVEVARIMWILGSRVQDELGDQHIAGVVLSAYEVLAYAINPHHTDDELYGDFRFGNGED